MEVRFCQYCGSKLDENGVCPHCPPAQVPAPRVEYEEAAERPVETPGASPEPPGAEAPAPAAGAPAPVAITPAAVAPPQAAMMQPAFAIPQNIVAYEAAMSAPAQPQKKHTTRTVLLILGGIFVAAAVAALFIFFNPADRVHFVAAGNAWDARDWDTAQAEYEQISPTYYMHIYVEEALRILREENPNDIALYEKGEKAWIEGRLYDAQAAYGKISTTYIDYDVVKDRLKLLSDNQVLVDLTRKTWRTQQDKRNCASSTRTAHADTTATSTRATSAGVGSKMGLPQPTKPGTLISPLPSGSF